MKIRIQGSKIIRYYQDERGRTKSETYFFNNHGVSNLIRRLSAMSSFTFDDEESFNAFSRVSDLLKIGKLV